MALGQRPCLSVFGHDYPTSDGTCVRDYIHVMDLAEGHTAACDKLFATPKIGCVAYNLGTGTGTSVLEMIKVRMLGLCRDGQVSVGASPMHALLPARVASGGVAGPGSLRWTEILPMLSVCDEVHF